MATIKDAANYLISLGHTKIAMVTSKKKYITLKHELVIRESTRTCDL